MHQFTIETFASLILPLVLSAMTLRHAQLSRAWRKLAVRPGSRVDVGLKEFYPRLEVLNRESDGRLFSALTAIKVCLPEDINPPRQDISGEVLLPVIKGRIGSVTVSGTKGFNWLNSPTIFTIVPSSWLEWTNTLPGAFEVSFVGSQDAMRLVNLVTLSGRLPPPPAP